MQSKILIIKNLNLGFNIFPVCLFTLQNIFMCWYNWICLLEKIVGHCYISYDVLVTNVGACTFHPCLHVSKLHIQEVAIEFSFFVEQSHFLRSLYDV